MFENLIHQMARANAEANVADITVHVTGPFIAMIAAVAAGFMLAAIVRRPYAYGAGGYVFTSIFAGIAVVAAVASGDAVGSAMLLPLAGLAYTLSYRLDAPMVPQPIASDVMRDILRVVH